MEYIEDIKRQLTDKFISDPTVQEMYELDLTKTFDEQFSKVSIENILFYTVAFGIYGFQYFLNITKSDITTTIENMKPHRVLWYISKIKAFQLGDILPADNDVYSTIDETKQIVKYCSINEQRGYLAIKVAGETNNLPTALQPLEVNALISYINKIKDAGVHYNVISRVADRYRATLRIYYDGLILNSDGSRVDGTNLTPVQESVENYIKSMPFDARYTNMALVDALQNIEGVKVADVVLAEAQYGANPWMPIMSIYTPDAGYMALDSLSVDYIAY
ncbi:MAG: hypothetical protein H6Q15_1769 [Bacteroidetes bacterium]|nr:hypothetical protein [Bacteroidota bacterium]